MPKKMKSISKLSAQVGAFLIDSNIPTIKDDEVLIKVLATSICGTDLHIYLWDEWSSKRINPPQIMGHEFAGRVVKVGKRVKTIAVGDIVSAETHIVCNECEFCLTGNAHICQHTSVLGVDRDGAFAQYIAIPATNAWKNDQNVPVEYLCIQEPLGNAVHTVLSADIVGKTVAVVGCGPIGIMAIDVAKAAGAKSVYAIEVNDYRCELARKIGADIVINPIKEDVINTILQNTSGLGVDVVCEMSGNPKAIVQALKYLKYGGHMSMLGVPTQDIAIDFAQDVVFKGITIYGVTGRRMYDTWYQVKGLVDSKKLHLDQIITHKLPFDEFEKGFALMQSGNCGKVVLMLED